MCAKICVCLLFLTLSPPPPTPPPPRLSLSLPPSFPPLSSPIHVRSSHYLINHTHFLFYSQLADELEALYQNYSARISTSPEEDRSSFNRSSRSTSGSKGTTSFLKSGSIDLTSSQESTSSEPFHRTPTRDHVLESSQTSQTSQTSIRTLTIPGSGSVPNYINIELKPRNAESSGSEIDEDLLLPPRERSKADPTAGLFRNSSPPPDIDIPVAVPEVPPTPFDDVVDDGNSTLTEQDVQNNNYPSPSAIFEDDNNDTEEDDEEKSSSFPNYANLEFAQVHNLLQQLTKPAPPSDEDPSHSKGPKKPMPIQRKTKSTISTSQPSQPAAGEETSKEVLGGSPVRNPVQKKPTLPVKPPNLLNQDSDSSLNQPKFQRTLTPTSTASNKSVSPLPALSKFLTSSNEGRTLDDGVVSTSVSTPPSFSKPRSHTTVEQLFTSSGEKKQPILPPATRYRSKSRSPSPVETPINTQPPSQIFKQKSIDDEKSKVSSVFPPSSTTAAVTVKKPALKPQVSEPTVVKNRAQVATPPPVSRTSKPTFTSYGGKFPRSTTVGGISTAVNNHTSLSGSNSDADELMKKLTLRRQRIDEQMAVTVKSSGSSYTTTKTSSPVPRPSPPSVSPVTSHRVSAPLSHKSNVTVSNSSVRSGEISSERNSTISTSSSSEVVVTYRKLDESPSMTSLSSNGTSYSLEGGGNSGVYLRKPEDPIETNLAKYGIIEEGGSYVI